MNEIAEVREEYKQAAREYIRQQKHKAGIRHLEFYQGKAAGLSVALSCLDVNSDEVREMYKTCEVEEAEHDRIHQAATDAANQIEEERAEKQAGDLIENTILDTWKRQGGIYKQAAEEYEKETKLHKQAVAELEEELDG